MTYYVAPDGSDASDGSRGHPFATIQKAADVADPGDTVVVRDGTYTARGEDDRMVHVRRSGTAAAPITFCAEHQWKAVLDGQHNKGSIAWDLQHEKELCYVRIEGFEIKGFSSHAFTLQGNTHHILIKGNHVHHIGNLETTTGNGLDGSYDDKTCSYITYDANVWHDIGRTGPPTMGPTVDHGIYTCGKHNVITNNVFYHCNWGWGVQVAGYDTVGNLVVSNNTFAYGGKRGQILLWLCCRKILIQNNIFYRPAVGTAIDFWEADLGDIVFRHNLVFGGELKNNDDQGVCQVSNTITGKDPQFVNPAQHDYHLGPGSPALGAGTADRAPHTDAEGRPRPGGAGTDLGAYQH